MTLSGKVQGGERKRTTFEVSKRVERCQSPLALALSQELS